MPQHTVTSVRAAFIFGAVVGGWLATPFITTLLIGDNIAEKGQAGDLFGSVNSLFSGLAFAGVIIAILLQREELALQRADLAMTREELRRSADAQERSQEALNKTIYAQSYKVAMDILEDPAAINNRRIVWERLSHRRNEPKNWGREEAQHADRVGRSLETVATMIRLGTLPSDYIIQTWSVPIVRYWWILERQTKELRAERNDLFIGKNFEWMAGQAVAFLRAQNVNTPEMNELNFNSA